MNVYSLSTDEKVFSVDVTKGAANIRLMEALQKASDILGWPVFKRIIGCLTKGDEVLFKAYAEVRANPEYPDSPKVGWSIKSQDLFSVEDIGFFIVGSVPNKIFVTWDSSKDAWGGDPSTQTRMLVSVMREAVDGHDGLTLIQPQKQRKRSAG